MFREIRFYGNVYHCMSQQKLVTTYVNAFQESKRREGNLHISLTALERTIEVVRRPRQTLSITQNEIEILGHLGHCRLWHQHFPLLTISTQVVRLEMQYRAH